MITDWREKWDQGDFPFLYVQLADFKQPQSVPAEEQGWAFLRDAQFKTLSLPNTGMASAVDIGDPNDIHPKDKLDVGLRLALAARHVAYRQDLVYSGPLYDSMKIDGNKIRISFKEVGGGLQMSTPPWTCDGVTPPEPTELTGFAIAGADQKWVWAKAQIDGNYGGGFERRRGLARGRPLWLGELSRHQPLQQRRTARLSLPHRQLAADSTACRATSQAAARAYGESQAVDLRAEESEARRRPCDRRPGAPTRPNRG